MTTNEFVQKYYTDTTYRENLSNKLKNKKSEFSMEQLSSHKKDIEQLRYNLLFTKVSNEVYSFDKKININLKAMI